MPTVKSQRTLQLLRSHRKIASVINDKFIMKFNPPPERVAMLDINNTIGEVLQDAPMPAIRVTPARNAGDELILLHLHGGAYISGGLLQCRAIISPIAAAARLQAVTFSYRLTPDYPYPAQLEDALAMYDYLLSKNYEPEQIGLVGESAGGNLALALCLRLRDMRRKLPGALALLSPWTDLNQTGESYRTLRNVDATLDCEELKRDALLFADGKPEKLEDPMLSPIYADFHDFPPTQIHCGTKEILLSDSDTLEEAMRRDHVPVSIVRWEGMCHVFQVYGFAESKTSNSQIGMFLRDTLLSSRT